MTKTPVISLIAARKKFTTIDEYHSSFSKNTRKILESMRRIIQQAAPRAEEVISYNMPAFKLNKVLVYYAAYKEHIGFYPTSMPIKAFEHELVKYKTSKGAIQFPIDKPMPANLIRKIVKYRVLAEGENLPTKKSDTKT